MQTAKWGIFLSLGLTRLAPSTLGDDCYRLLKDAILNLDLPPGTVLVEHQLATQLGISKTPVREALARLAGECLIVPASNGRQSRVSGLSLTTIRELYQVRILIESALLREIGHNLKAPELLQLEQFIEESAQAVELEGFGGLIDANDAFHLYLIRRSGNQTLVAHMAGIFQQLHRVRAALRMALAQDSAPPEFSREGLEGHRKILEALVNHDAERASELMRADISWFLGLLDSGILQPAIKQLSLGSLDEE